MIGMVLEMKVLVLFNPFSSKQKISKNKQLVIDKLSTKYEVVEFFESTAPKSITDKIAKDGNEYDLLLISGGDGTLNEAVNGIVRGGIKTSVAYIPSGTVNDVGSILGLKKNVKKGLDIALNGDAVKIDVCKLEEHAFVYVCAAGKYTSISYDISYKLKKRLGRFAYFVRGIKELPKKGGMNFRVETNGVTEDINCFLFFALNYRQFGGFKFYRRNNPYLNDGIVDFTFIEKRKRCNLFRTAKFVLFGDRVKKGVKTISSDSIKITCDEEIDFNVDGELAHTGKEATISVLKEELSIIVPEKYKKKFLKS